MNIALSHRFLLIWTLVTTGAFAAVSHGHHDHNPDMATAWHEFAMFGKKKIFLSHLSVFHSIHNYQALVEVSLDEASKEKYLAADGVRFRLSPTDPTKTEGSVQDRLQDWKLPDYMHVGVKFNGDIQQGKVVIASNATVTVTRVIHFNGYDDNDPRPKELSYVLFGSPGEAYLAHFLKHFPDFDQILAVDVTSGLTAFPESTPQPGPKYTVVGPAFTIPNTTSEPEEYSEDGEKKYRFRPLEVGQTVKAVRGDSVIQLKVSSEIFKAFTVPREF